jgi:hypothetical protein
MEDAHDGDLDAGNDGLETFRPDAEFVEFLAAEQGSEVETSPLAGVHPSATAEPQRPHTDNLGAEPFANPELELGDAFQVVGFEESACAEALAVGEGSSDVAAEAAQPSLFDASANDRVAAERGVASAPSDAPERALAVETLGDEQVRSELLSRAFVTETMAELYCRQGFFEEALGIYRQLAAQRPEDAELQERVARLEFELGPHRAEQWSMESLEARAEAGAPRERPSVTIRSLFASIAARRAPAAYAWETPARESTEVDRRSEVNGDSKPTGALGELFEGGSVTPGDNRVATALASAFSAEFSGSPAATPGEPTRAADDELSLDDIFGAERVQSEREGGSPNVSFDEFFGGENGARGAEERSDRSEGESDSPQDGSSDLELFHAWLEGLKK